MNVVDASIDRRWWLASKEDLAAQLAATVRMVMAHPREVERLKEARDLARLFEEHAHQTFYAGSPDVDGLPRNILASIVETAHNSLTDQHPRPFYGSDGGDADLRFRLEDLNTAITGLFLAYDADERADFAQLHACLWGTGVVKVDALLHTKKPRVVVERVYPWEVFVDPLDSMYGTPSVFYQVRWLDRRKLLADWPRRRDEIRHAPTSRPDWATWLGDMSDPVMVTEAWHLDPDGGETGRHVIAVENAVLLDEDYEHDAPPLVFFGYSDALTGFWGRGLGQVLRGQQEEVNEQMDLIQEIVARMGSPAMLVEKQSEVEEGHLDNQVGRVIKYKGVAPQALAPQGLTAEPRQHLLDTVAAMYERAGLPQSSVTGQKPAGLQSGRALRVQADLASGRLRVPSEKRSRSYLALGHALIRAQRKLSAVEPDALVIFTDPKDRAVRRLRWADVDVQDDGLKLIGQPISSLPSTPGAKAAVLDEYLGAGIITPDEYREAIGLADTLALDRTATAPRRLIERQILGILRDGTSAVPEGYFPLALAQQLGQQHYCQAQLDGVPIDDPRMGLLRAYIDSAVDQQKPPPPPPQPEPPPGPEMPPPEGAVAPVDPNLPPPELTTTAAPPMAA